MTSYLVGKELVLTVPVIDQASKALVDPATLAFRLVAPEGSSYPTGLYSWNGSTWTSSESVIAIPARLSLGTFILSITIPYANVAQGRWVTGWKSTANGNGLGEGSGELPFVATPTGALPP